MQIKRLRIAGFKSFVDPADLRIERGLTGVVGPNGCGKSNLLEALRWTMGENSAKSLRGAGMDDVIFAGTATRPPRDFAEVSILLDTGDAANPDEREVVRRIERGAGSAYRIDGRDVRAKDVGLLFADAATGAHSPALVSQNRIGAVIAAKPAERRAMLEEAAGIAGLHVRRKDAEQKLRATEANLVRLDELIADQDTRAAALRRQARAAERYRALSEQIRVAEARMIFARWRDAVAAADAARIEAQAAEARVTDATTAEHTAAKARHAAAEALATTRAAALAARDRASEAGHQLATLRTERTAAARRVADLADSRRRIAEDRTREGTLAADAAAALTRATQRTGRDRLLDHLTPAAGYERALGAALGDDLEAGLAAWTGAAPHPSDPAPPAGAEPLATHVEAPAALARRLAQIFVAEDTGQPLAVGQRLVTRDGTLRRWDGFVATGNGAAAAERLERLNRLKALQAARPAAAAALNEAEDARAAIDRAIATARAAAQTARATLNQSEAAARDAERAEDRAAAALERLAGQRADLDTRAARIAAEQAEAQADLAAARTARDALPDGRESAAAVAALTQAANHHRNTVATARERRTTLDRAVQNNRERLAAAQADTRSWRARAGEAAKRIADMDKRDAALATEAADVADRPAALDVAIAAQEANHAAARVEADAQAAAERTAATALTHADDAHRRAVEALSQAREARAGTAARLENQDLRRVEMGRLSGERFECPAPVLPERLHFAVADVRTPAEEAATHERLSADRERIGPVNLVAATELAELESAGQSNAAERDELGQAVNRLRGSIGTLNREGRQRLLAAFEAVDGHFRRLFTTLFDGGAAHLELIDSDDPLEAGLEIMAQPPGKRLQSLTLLSGGEQALTAVALIFALFLTNPAPICVLDEVDAPLDDANIERFCDLLDRMTQETDTRYLIVTHNAVTMSRMHRLFGVTMVERGVSRLVSVDLGGATTLLAAE